MVSTLTPLLNVSDCKRSVGFYADALGFKVEKQFEMDSKLVWATLSRGPVSLMVNVSSESARSPEGVQDIHQKTYDDVVLYFSVEDAPALYEELVAKGLTPGRLETQAYGLDEFTLRDPDGYELAFGSPVRNLP